MDFYISYCTSFYQRWNNLTEVDWRVSSPSMRLIPIPRNTISLRQVKDMMSLNIKLIKKNGDNIFLITDRKGFSLFSDLKWTKIYTNLENMPKINLDIWSFGKLWALYFISKQRKPFFHIDYDFFIFKKLEDNILNSKVVVQSLEYKISSIYKLDLYEKYCPRKYIQDYSQINYAYNCGIMGGTDYNFWEKYSIKAIQAVLDKKNSCFWEANHKDMLNFEKACIAEQYFLACFLKEKNINPTLLFNNENTYYAPTRLDYFNRTHAIHFYGTYKEMILSGDKFDINKFLNILDIKKAKEIRAIIDI